MTQKITTATQSQWDEVERIRQRWLFEEQVAQHPVQEIRQCAEEFLADAGMEAPVMVVDSPLVARLIANLRGNLHDNLRANLRDNLHANLSANLYANLRANLRDNLHANLYDNLHANLRDNLHANLHANLDDNLHANLDDNLYDNLHANLDDNLRANLRDNLRANLDANLDANLSTYCGLWWNVRAAWFEGGSVLGVPELPCLEKFVRFNRLCPVWMWSKNMVFILRRPREIHWQSTDGVLHNDAGPSVYYSSCFALWHLEGVAVDRQVVMHPETQTVTQINNEKNEEVRRIRIERFGVMRYLQESDAAVLDSRRNEVENTYEILVETPYGRRLVTHCPSTGRRYFLSFPGEAETCESAQRALWGIDANIIGRT